MEYKIVGQTVPAVEFTLKKEKVFLRNLVL